MNYEMKIMRTLIKVILFAGAATILITCSEGKNPKKTEMNSSVIDTSISNGERIYFSSIDNKGNEITYSEGPYSGMMMMGRMLTCASCHGPDGKGGNYYIMMGQKISSPDIRWKVLSEEDGGGQPGHKEYGLDMFKMEIEEGKYSTGDTMSLDMPRWNMSNEDLTALMNYLKTLK
jgi:cytochrome c oxidase subunit 2